MTIEVGGGGIDPFLLTALNERPIFNQRIGLINFIPTMNGGFEVALSRSGSGYISYFVMYARQAAEVLVDGVLVIQTTANDSANLITLVDPGNSSADLDYIKYTSSIEVRLKSTLSNTNTAQFAHVIAS